jgi:hypothetical protein
MRIIFIYLLLLAVTVNAQRVIIPAPVPRVQVATGPPMFAYESEYLFEQVLTDELGNYNGSAEGAISYNADSKEGSWSLELNSNDEGSDIGNFDFGTVGFSVSFWHKYANVTNAGAFVLISNRPGTAGSDGWGAWLNTWATTDGKLRTYTGDGADQDGASSTAGAYNNGAWNHLVFVYEVPGIWTFYVNAVDVTDDSSTQDDFATSGNTTLIGNWSSLDFSGDGLYDGFRIYKKSLTSSEVSSIYAEY